MKNGASRTPEKKRGRMKREKLKIGDYEIETIEWPRSWFRGVADAIEDG